MGVEPRQATEPAPPTPPQEEASEVGSGIFGGGWLAGKSKEKWRLLHEVIKLRNWNLKFYGVVGSQVLRDGYSCSLERPTWEQADSLKLTGGILFNGQFFRFQNFPTEVI